MSPPSSATFSGENCNTRGLLFLETTLTFGCQRKDGLGFVFLACNFNNPHKIIMKKVLLVVSLLSVVSLGYANEGCGSGCGDKKPADSTGPAKPADKAPEAPKS